MNRVEVISLAKNPRWNSLSSPPGRFAAEGSNANAFEGPPTGAGQVVSLRGLLSVAVLLGLPSAAERAVELHQRERFALLRGHQVQLRRIEVGTVVSTSR